MVKKIRVEDHEELETVEEMEQFIAEHGGDIFDWRITFSISGPMRQDEALLVGYVVRVQGLEAEEAILVATQYVSDNGMLASMNESFVGDENKQLKVDVTPWAQWLKEQE